MNEMGLAREAIEHGAVQKDVELAQFIEFLGDRRIRTALEIGSLDGGMVWLFAQLAAERVISVDLNPVPASEMLYPVPTNFVCGDSHSPETAARVKKILRGELVDLLFIDGDHSYEGVRRDFALYGDMVADGGVVGFHDIVDHGNPEASEVHRYWDEFKASCQNQSVIHEFIFDGARDLPNGAVLPFRSCGIGVWVRPT